MGLMVKKLLILTCFILVSSSFAVAQGPGPTINGFITIDGVPQDGITVQVKNRDTGVIKSCTTTCGSYIVVFTVGQDEDVIESNVTINGNTYSNTTIVNTKFLHHWLNISISTDEPDVPPYNPPDDNGNDDDEPEEPEDEPENNETEEPDDPPENNTDNDIPSLYNLTVTVFDNTTNSTSRVNNASVTIYNNNETKITKSYTNETGEAVFLLEEGIYIIKVEKDNHPPSFHTVNLLASMKYTTYMSSQNEGNNKNPIRSNEQGFPVVYFGIVVIVIILACVVIFFYRRREM